MYVRSGIKNATAQIFLISLKFLSHHAIQVVMCKSLYFKGGHLPMPIVPVK